MITVNIYIRKKKEKPYITLYQQGQFSQNTSTQPDQDKPGRCSENCLCGGVKQSGQAETQVHSFRPR